MICSRIPTKLGLNHSIYGLRLMTTNENENYSPPIYKIKEGVRYVEPYFQNIKTTVKSRWLDRTVLDILSSEFRNISRTEYKNRLEKDEIKVIHRKKMTKKERKQQREMNGNKVNEFEVIKYPQILQYKLRDNDVIERLEHIHERSVAGIDRSSVDIIYEDEDTLVVNKPSGIPIHPVQNYYYNSFMQILQHEGWPGRSGNEQLRPCFRLDKLTSGICIFAKNTETARKIQMDIQSRYVEKVYLARVKGLFPDGKVDCNDEVIVLDTKKGKEEGILRKNAQTIFEKVKYNKELDESIVMCWPKTGRTHQIRIHLRNLQHPIVNDPLYGYGKLMSLEKFTEFGNYHVVSNECFEKIKKEADENRTQVESDERCDICGVKLYNQSRREDLVMYLHAFEYRLKEEGGWSYKTNWPKWSEI